MQEEEFNRSHIGVIHRNPKRWTTKVHKVIHNSRNGYRIAVALDNQYLQQGWEVVSHFIPACLVECSDGRCERLFCNRDAQR